MQRINRDATQSTNLEVVDEVDAGGSDSPRPSTPVIRCNFGDHETEEKQQRQPRDGDDDDGRRDEQHEAAKPAVSSSSVRALDLMSGN